MEQPDAKLPRILYAIETAARLRRRAGEGHWPVCTCKPSRHCLLAALEKLN